MNNKIINICKLITLLVQTDHCFKTNENYDNAYWILNNQLNNQVALTILSNLKGDFE